MYLVCGALRPRSIDDDQRTSSACRVGCGVGLRARSYRERLEPGGTELHGERDRNADRVAFTSFRPGNWDLYLFRTATEQPERLTTDPNLDYDSVISPDGRWLVFASERRGTPDLFVQDLQEGESPHFLIDSDSLEDQAAFAPDGKSLAFVSTFSGNADIYQLPFQPDRTVSMRRPSVASFWKLFPAPFASSS